MTAIFFRFFFDDFIVSFDKAYTEVSTKKILKIVYVSVFVI